jgi:sporulation protein YlmC with PRC-barrel domain/predicted nucleic acid-binding Zn ribbon protein
MAEWRRREELLGKEVIDGDAKKIGVTKDLAWSNDGTLAIIVEHGDEEEAFLSFEEIEKIGDVVFVKAKTALETVPAQICPVCRHKNPLEAKFCAKCGRTLEGKEKKEEKREKKS